MKRSRAISWLKTLSRWALIALAVWLATRVEWSGFADSLGIRPSPTKFLRLYLEDSDKAVKEYSLATDRQATETWAAALMDVPRDAEVLGHEYVVTQWPKSDVSQKSDIYLVMYRSKGKVSGVLIKSHRTKERKFTPAYTSELSEEAIAEVKKMIGQK